MMQKKDKELLESNDLMQLHKKFDPEPVKEERTSLPASEVPPRADLWSQAIRAVSEKNIASMKDVHTRLQHGDLAPDGKAWWDVLLAAGMKAPLYELERLHKVYGETPQMPDAACIYMAAGELAGKAARREREKRRQKELEEQGKLRDLQQVVDERQAEKRTAEENLRQHTRY